LVAAIPPNPKWPENYSCGIIKTNNSVVLTGRWFYDHPKRFDRYDFATPNGGWDIEINDYKNGKRYLIHRNKDFSASCKVVNFNGQFPVPNFGPYKYVGVTSMNSWPVDQWEYDTAVSKFVYYDQISSNDPVRLSRTVNDKFDSSNDYFEFDIGPQNPLMFNATYVAPGACQ